MNDNNDNIFISLSYIVILSCLFLQGLRCCCPKGGVGLEHDVRLIQLVGLSVTNPYKISRTLLATIAKYGLPNRKK